MSSGSAASPGIARWFAFIVGFGLLLGGGSRAWAADNSESIPPVFDKAVPENKQDLQAIERHVKRLLKKSLPATVGVLVGGAQGSGVIVTKDGMVLTAGHVSGTPERKCKIILPDGRTVSGKTLGANYGIDSGMVQITDQGEYPFCEMADLNDLKAGQWCIAIGHPGGWQKGRQPVVRLGRIQTSSKTFIQTDCALVGGDSGGPLFDMQGKVIGIHSRIGNLLTANIHVPVSTYRETWERLAAGEEWGSSFFGGKQNTETFLGVTLDDSRPDCRISEITPESPAAKAGLRINDIVRTFDGKKIGNRDDLGRFIRSRRPGAEISMEVNRGEDIVIIHVTLGKRPT